MVLNFHPKLPRPMLILCFCALSWSINAITTTKTWSHLSHDVTLMEKEFDKFVRVEHPCALNYSTKISTTSSPNLTTDTTSPPETTTGTQTTQTKSVVHNTQSTTGSESSSTGSSTVFGSTTQEKSSTASESVATASTAESTTAVLVTEMGTSENHFDTPKDTTMTDIPSATSSSSSSSTSSEALSSRLLSSTSVQTTSPTVSTSTTSEEIEKTTTSSVTTTESSSLISSAGKITSESVKSTSSTTVEPPMTSTGTTSKVSSTIASPSTPSKSSTAMPSTRSSSSTSTSSSTGRTTVSTSKDIKSSSTIPSSTTSTKVSTKTTSTTDSTSWTSTAASVRSSSPTQSTTRSSSASSIGSSSTAGLKTTITDTTARTSSSTSLPIKSSSVSGASSSSGSVKTSTTASPTTRSTSSSSTRSTKTDNAASDSVEVRPVATTPLPTVQSTRTAASSESTSSKASTGSTVKETEANQESKTTILGEAVKSTKATETEGTKKTEQLTSTKGTTKEMKTQTSTTDQKSTASSTSSSARSTEKPSTSTVVETKPTTTSSPNAKSSSTTKQKKTATQTSKKTTQSGSKTTTTPNETTKTPTASTTTSKKPRTETETTMKSTQTETKTTTAEPTSTSAKRKSTSTSSVASTSSQKATTTEKKTPTTAKAKSTKLAQVTTSKKESTTSSTKGTSAGKNSTPAKTITPSTKKGTTVSTKQTSSTGKTTTGTSSTKKTSTTTAQKTSKSKGTKTAASKTTVPKTTATRTSATKSIPTKSTTSKTTATKTAAPKTTATKTTATKTTGSKTTTSKPTASKKTATKTTASKKTASKTTATVATAPITASSYEHLLRTTHPVDTKKYQTIYTQLPSTRCDRECPEGYIVGQTACIYPVPFYYADTYQRAFGFCASHEHSALLTEQEFVRNRPSILKWARETNTTLLQTDIYLFAYPLPYSVKGHSFVDIVTLGNLTLARINTTRVGYFEKRKGMTALCKVPKYCESLNCPLEPVYEKLAAELPLPMVSDEIKYRALMKLACKPPSKTVLRLQCHPFGVIKPYIENLKCSYPPGLEPEIETPTNKKVRNSCAECYDFGTESCEAVDGGYICNCKAKFHKFTCWKAEEICKGRKDNGLCSGRGKCTSLLGDFKCNCDRFFHGRQCRMDSRKVSMFGDDEHMPVISAPTISNGIIFLSSVIIWISVNVASGHLNQIFRDDGPQTVFVMVRNINIFFASLVATFFSRPALMYFNPILCRLSYNLHYGCVYYGLAMLVSETWTVANVYGAQGSNIWGYDPYGKYIKELSIDWGVLWAVLPLMPIIYAGNMFLWDSIYMSSTCLGPVSATDPTYLVSIGILAGMVVAVFYYGQKANYDRWNNEERIISMLHYMEIKLPLKIGRLDRVQRNRWFPVVMAPVLFFQYLLTQISLDFVADGYFYLDLAVIILGIVWAVLALAQFITIHDYVLEFVMVRCQPIVPWLPWPIHTPISYLNWDEIEALRTGKPVKNPERWKDWKYQPSFPDYISEENRTHFLRKISSQYIIHRTDGDMKPVEAIQAIFEEHTILLHKTTPLSEQLRELTTKWMLEMNAWDIHELKLWHCPCHTEEEEARQFIDHPFMTRSAIDAELRIVEGFKRVRRAIHYNPVRINDTVKVLKRGQNRLLDFFSTMFVVWRAEKAKVAPGRQRRQLAKLEKIYKKTKEQMHIDHCLAHPEDDFSIDYLYNENRPTFVGPRRRGSLYDFPYMSEFLALRWYDERLNEKEWKDLEFDHWVSWRLIALDGVTNRLTKFEEQARWVKEYHAKRLQYEREELIWRLGGRKEDDEHGKTYRQLKAERPSFEDRFPQYKEDKYATLPHEFEMMREGGLPMPPPRPRDLYLEELPREFPFVPDFGYADADLYDF